MCKFRNCRSPSFAALIVHTVILFMPFQARSQEQSSSAAAFNEEESALATRLQQHPGPTEERQLRERLGAILTAKGQYARALAVLHVLPEETWNATVRTLVAIDYCQEGAYLEGGTLLASKEQPDMEVNLARIAGPCLVHANELAAATLVFQSLVAQRADPLDETMLQYTETLLRLKSVLVHKLQSKPEAKPFLEKLKAFSASGQANAKEVISEAVNLLPYHDEGDATLTDVLHLQDKHPLDAATWYLSALVVGQEAVRAGSELEARYPDSPYVRAFEAKVLSSQGADGEAEQIFTSLLEDALTPTRALDEVCPFFARKEDWDRALQCFSKESAADPKDLQALAGVSESLLKLRRYDDLIQKDTKHLTAHSPVWLFEDLADSYLASHELDKGLEVLKQGVRAAPRDSSLHYRLAQAYRRGGDLQDARKEMDLYQSTREHAGRSE